MIEETARDAIQTEGPEVWVDRHGDCLYRYALARLRTPEAAADVVQETFLEAFRSRTTFAGRSSERTWLVGILRHKVVDHLRQARRSGALPRDDDRGTDFDQRGHWQVYPASWVGEPGRLAESREFWDAVLGCLARLPSGLADTFLLREFEGMSAAEVQRHLAITPANLWARLHRARSLLRRCLEEHWFADHPPPRARTPHGSARSPRP